MAVIAVSGMAFEARIAAGVGVHAISRKDEGSLADAISKAIGKGCRGLISFGVAGGLVPHLRPGTCVVASTIFHDKNQFHTDRSWSRNLLELIPNAAHGGIVGVSSPVADPDAKGALHTATGSVAVDMESHIVAGIAAKHGLPVAAIRVIADSATCALPRSALVALRPNGTIDIGAFTSSILRAPNELPTLLRIARYAIVSGFALRRNRRLIGASFGLP
jgi:hopanoid-associated phosphorylase